MANLIQNLEPFSWQDEEEQVEGSEDKAQEEEEEFPEDPLFGKTFEIPEDAEEIDLPKGMKYKGEWKVPTQVSFLHGL